MVSGGCYLVFALARLAKAATDLRVEDWDDDTVERFKENLAMYKKTAEEFQSSESESADSAASTYEIRFRSDDGSSEVFIIMLLINVDKDGQDEEKMRKHSNMSTERMFE